MSLISTSDLRTWLALEEGDTKPNAKLDAVSKAIMDFVDSFTNRKLEAARYNSDPNYTYMDGNGEPWIYLPQYPVSYVYSANVDADRLFASGTLIASDDLILYPKSGKLVSEAGYFTRGRQNIKIDYIAGYAPVVGGTHNALVSSYPLPYDLRQVMIEMTVECFKEGIMGVHTIQGGPEFPSRIMQLLSGNSLWANTLNKYKAFDLEFSGMDER